MQLGDPRNYELFYTKKIRSREKRVNSFSEHSRSFSDNLIVMHSFDTVRTASGNDPAA